MAAYNKICKACREEFIARRYDVETCSSSCSVKWQYLKKQDKKLKEKLQIDKLFNQCIWCGSTFKVKHKTTVLCSAKCRTNYNYNKGKIDLNIDFNKITQCILCNDKKPLKDFQKRGKKFLKVCKDCLLEKKTSYNPNYLQVEEFILKMEKKSYYADYSEIFELISLYDLVFPKLLIPSYTEPEYIFNAIFSKLYVWYRQEKKKLNKG